MRPLKRPYPKCVDLDLNCYIGPRTIPFDVAERSRVETIAGGAQGRLGSMKGSLVVNTMTHEYIERFSSR